MSALDVALRHRHPSGFELDVAFTCEPTVTALLGPSGSGKSSLFSMLAGFLSPDHGRITLGDTTLFDRDAGVDLPPERRRLAVVFQDHLLFPHLSVEKNLLYGRRRRSTSQPIDFERLVDILDLRPLLSRRPSTLSGGESQRVALGRALLSGAELLLMDEPLASLDEPLKLRILDHLDQVLAEWRIPTLFVTHSQAEARRLARDVIALEDGRVIASGALDEVLGRPEALAWKDATAPVNLLRIDDVAREDGRLLGRLGEQRLQLPDDGVATRSSVFVRCDPAAVTLSRHEVDGLSVRNRLTGRVRQVVPVEGAVFVAVDVGQLLWSEITAEAAAELELVDDLPVSCLLKTQGLRLLD
ncbi:MAG: molybdenum ABC transporter ATP-binding protein [Acidobacteriota bacterium]